MVGLSLTLALTGAVEAQVILRVDGESGLPGGDGDTWATAFKYLQDALAEAGEQQPGTTVQIWVAARIPGNAYRPDRDANNENGSQDPQASFNLLNDVEIYGGFAGGETMLDERDPEANETVLSGDFSAGPLAPPAPDACDNPPPGAGDCFEETPGIPGCTNFECCAAVCEEQPICCIVGWSEEPCVTLANTLPACTTPATATYHVVTASDVDSSARLDGFTITGGLATGIDPLLFEDSGGGMLIDDAGPEVVRCTFIANTADFGGAMAVFTDNNLDPSVPFVVNCRFLGNSATFDGGAVFNLGSTPALTNCEFSGNQASVFGGAIANNAGEPLLGLMPNPLIVNCTMSLNTAALGGGVSNDSNSEAMLFSCVVWDNMLAQLDGPGFTVQFSDIEGGFPGIGNIGDDPLFLDADGVNGIAGDQDDDLRLELGSPCNDTGKNTAVPPDAVDLDGDGDSFEPMPLDLALLDRFVTDATAGALSLCDPVAVDMGAYENADCNGNGLRDEDESLPDVNGDGIPDECQDCNNNGVPDPDDIAGGESEDCNENGLPDECDIVNGCSVDCSGEVGVPDECEVSVGTNLRSFLAPVPSNGRGLAFDGFDLYYTIFPDDPNTPEIETDFNIYRIRTLDGALQAMFVPTCPDDIPVNRQIGALAFADRGGTPTLWAATYDFQDAIIFQIDIDSGDVIQTIDDLPAASEDSNKTHIDGLAYDPSDNSLYYSTDLGFQVFNIDAEGGRGCNALSACVNSDKGYALAEADLSGHAFDGIFLYSAQPIDCFDGPLGCNSARGDPNASPPPVVFSTSVDSATRTLEFQPLITPEDALSPEDMAFDDVTFPGQCAVWINEAGETNRIAAFEVPCPCPPPICPADFNGNCEVGIEDFLQLLAAWGPCPGCPEDLVVDGDVGIKDFLLIIASWGPCPEPCIPDDPGQPASIRQKVQDAGLNWPTDWDDFEWTMRDPNVSEAEKDNWRCWIDHYLDCHTRPNCFECVLCLALCPDDDPYGGH